MHSCEVLLYKYSHHSCEVILYKYSHHSCEVLLYKYSHTCSGALTLCNASMPSINQIGTPFFRGVSGGERKRTNIGMELIIEPQVLFLDEPTTGLDAHTAVSVVSLLKK